MKSKNSIYLVCGQPASGKTTLALTLAKKLTACLVDIDAASEPIIQAAMMQINGNLDDRDSPIFKSLFREPIHKTLFSIALSNLPINPVVIAAPFTKEQRNPNWISELRQALNLDADIFAIYLYCDSETLKSRLERRGNERDRAKLERWESYQAYYQPEPPAFPHLAINTSSEAEIDRAIESLTH